MLSMGGFLATGGGSGHMGGAWVGGGEGEGEGGRGHFHLAALYCTITWCFALKGLRTTNLNNSAPDNQNVGVKEFALWRGVESLVLTPGSALHLVLITPELYTHTSSFVTHSLTPKERTQTTLVRQSRHTQLCAQPKKCFLRTKDCVLGKDN